MKATASEWTSWGQPVFTAQAVDDLDNRVRLAFQGRKAPFQRFNCGCVFSCGAPSLNAGERALTYVGGKL